MSKKRHSKVYSGEAGASIYCGDKIIHHGVIYVNVSGVCSSCGMWLETSGKCPSNTVIREQNE